MSDRSGSRCENCRHPYWDYHMEATRLSCTAEEARKGRCNDCTICLEPEPAKDDQRDKVLV